MSKAIKVSIVGIILALLAILHVSLMYNMRGYFAVGSEWIVYPVVSYLILRRFVQTYFAF